MLASLVIMAKNKNDFCSELDALLEKNCSQSLPLKLSGVILSDLEGTENIARRYPGLKIFSDTSDALWSDKNTVIWIKDPLALRPARLLEILVHRPAAVICEPPFSIDYENALKIAAAYLKAGIPLIINHPTRFCPRLQQIAAAIQNGLIGKFLGGNAYYSSGLMRGGLHLFSLVDQILGMPNHIQAMSEGTIEGADPVIGGRISYHAHVHINILAIDARDYDLFELDLCGSQGRIQIRGLSSVYQVFLTDEKGVPMAPVKIPFVEAEPHPDLGVLKHTARLLQSDLPEISSAAESLSALRLALTMQKSHLLDGIRIGTKKEYFSPAILQSRPEQIA